MNTELTMEDLEQRPLSYSSLKEFMRSPLHFIYYRQRKRIMTPALIMGTLVDVLILTPDEYESRFVVMPVDAPRRPSSSQLNAKKPSPETTAAIAWWEDFHKEHGHKLIISQEDLEQATAMKTAVFTNEDAMYYLSQIEKTQLKLNWTDKDTGLPMVSIPDGVGECLVSLKTTADASPSEFQRSAFTFNYHIQSAIELEGLKKTKAAFPDVYYIVVEKSEPYGVSVLKADKNFLNLGAKKFDHAKKEFKMCLDQKRFHEGYEFRARTLERKYHHLELPGWAMKELSE